MMKSEPVTLQGDLVRLEPLRLEHAHELGAVREGVLRNHFILPDGSYRHTVYFSIIQSEWPAVKARLEGLMQR